MPSRTIRLLALCLCLPPRFPTAQSPSASLPSASQADLLTRLAAAQDATNLTDPALKPWHMLATFDLLDPKGAITEHGTYEEWWAAPDRWKITWTSPSSSATIIHDGKASFQTPHAPPPPHLLDLLQVQLTHPLASPDDLSRLQAVQQPRTIGQITLSCTMLEPRRGRSEPDASLFLYATSCFDPGSSKLRLNSFGSIPLTTQSRFGAFQGKTVALDVAISEGAGIMAKASVTQLTTFTPSDTDFAPKPQLEATDSPSLAAARLPSNVMAGRKTGGTPPSYPVYAKQNHLSGAVVLKALIGPNGHILSLQPLSWPAPSLADAAMIAVRTWTYQPYLLNGVPVTVETTLTINFNFG